MTPQPIQPELDLQAEFVGDIDDDAPWPMPPGGPIRWPSPAAYVAPAPVPMPSGILAAIGGGIVGALLGMVRT